MNGCFNCDLYLLFFLSVGLHDEVISASCNVNIIILEYTYQLNFAKSVRKLEVVKNFCATVSIAVKLVGLLCISLALSEGREVLDKRELIRTLWRKSQQTLQ